jgi:hypothetical protein
MGFLLTGAWRFNIDSLPGNNYHTSSVQPDLLVLVRSLDCSDEEACAESCSRAILGLTNPALIIAADEPLFK